jgi:protein ImuB
VVEQAQERHFLAPLPITLLPLPLPSLREMNWLGIDTLDVLARLPASSVLQRWGKPGVIAQRLAQGRDERPVVSTQSALPAPVDVDFETLCENVEQATADVLRAFAATVARVAERLCGCQGLQLTLGFLDRQTHVHDLIFAAPVYDATSIGKALARAMRSRAWPAPLTSACIAITALNELPSGQLSLFDDDDAWTGQTGDSGAAQRYADLIDRAGRKYPGAFYGARLAVPSHRAPERRVLWTRLGDER